MYLKIDDGYTKACPVCDKRFGSMITLVGKPREVAIELCPPCAERALIPQKRKYK